VIRRTADLISRIRLNATGKLAIGIVVAEFSFGVLTSVYASILFLGLLVLFGTWIVWAAVVCGALGVLIARGQWRSFGFALALLAGSVCAAIPAFRVGLWAGYEARFWGTKPFHDAEVAQLKQPGQARLVAWEWNAYMIFNTIYLVYDEQDQFALPPQRQSSAWKELVGTKIDGSAWSAEHLYGHYYLVTTA
jgi:hypothetical protein